MACCVWLWPKSQPAGSGSPCHQCLSGSRHFSLCIIIELQAPVSVRPQWNADSELLHRPARGPHSVFKGPKSCRKTVFLPLLSGMYEEIFELAVLTAPWNLIQTVTECEITGALIPEFMKEERGRRIRSVSDKPGIMWVHETHTCILISPNTNVCLQSLNLSHLVNK